MTDPRPFQIGPHRLANNLVLAPMAGVSDRPFRTLCRRLGAGLTVSEMVAANTALHGSRKSVRRLDFDGEQGPIMVQLLGADPEAMAEAARLHVDLGADIIDINMGCPAKKVCRKAAGSALLRDERLVGAILEATVGAVAVPVTLKIRTGWSPEERNSLRIAQIAREAGIAALSVHGRTRACTYATPAEHDSLRAIRAALPDLTLIANGDIDGPERARAVLAHSGADALMIGRAAQGRPWIFGDIAAGLAGRPAPPPPRQWICDLLSEHLDALYGFYGNEAGVRIARKHIAWYSRQLPGASAFRERINSPGTPGEQLALVRAFFDASLDTLSDSGAGEPQGALRVH